jgi:hypothetical protein
MIGEYLLITAVVGLACFLYGRFVHRDEKTLYTSSLSDRRAYARKLIMRMRELPIPQRHVRDSDLDAFEAGLQEPPA